ncbi:MAG: hypothetical protein E5W55_07280, partial [Mesorhizobium sp.]
MSDAAAGPFLSKLTQSQSRLMRKKPFAAAVASGRVEATHCIRDLENLRTESTFPSTIGNGVRGHWLTDGV